MTLQNGIRSALAATAIFLGAPDLGLAETPLPKPIGQIILTVGGSISNANGPGNAAFDLEMLEELGLTTLETHTAWVSGSRVFEGVLVRKLLERVGASGDTIEATALNDYSVSIPASDVERYDVLLAIKMDGEYLQVWDKGPIWVVYPRDQYHELQDSQIDKKWIWQLYNIVVD